MQFSITRSRLRKLAFLLRHAGAAARLAARPRAVRRIRTSLRLDELVLLDVSARRVPAAGVIVEIGSYLGASTCVLAAGARRPGVCVHAVDTWRNEGMHEGPRDTFAEFQSNTARFAPAIRALRGRSEDVGRGFDRDIDLLFVDGDHSLEGCGRDAAIWLPKVREGGTVIFHDSGWAAGVQAVLRDTVASMAPAGVRRLDNIAWAVLRGHRE